MIYHRCKFIYTFGEKEGCSQEGNGALPCKCHGKFSTRLVNLGVSKPPMQRIASPRPALCPVSLVGIKN